MKYGQSQKFLQQNFIELIFLISVVISSPLTLHAQEKTEITLTQALKAGLNRSPFLKKLRAELEGTSEEIKQNRSSFLPTLNWSSTAAHKNFGNASTSDTEDDYLTYIELSQPLFTSGALTGGSRLLKINFEIAQNKLFRGEQQIIYDIATAYFESLKAQELFDAAKTNETTFRKHLDVIKKYFNIGRAKKTDRLQAELNWLTSQSAILDAETKYVIAREALRILLATDELPALKAIPISEFTPTNSSHEKAYRQNHLLRIAELTALNVENEKKLDLAKDLPQLKLSGQYGYRADNTEDWINEPYNYSSIGVTLNIPLFSGFSSFAKRRTYEFKKVGASREVELQKLAIDAAVNDAIQNLKAAERKYETAQEIYKKADIAIQIASAEYNKNLISNSDLFNVQRTKYDADRLFIEAKSACHLARLKYAFETGEKLQDHYLIENKK